MQKLQELEVDTVILTARCLLKLSSLMERNTIFVIRISGEGQEPQVWKATKFADWKQQTFLKAWAWNLLTGLESDK